MVANAVKDSVDFIGMPEGFYPLAEATIYLATAPKSNSAYMAIEQALGDVKDSRNDPVPLHLRNAPTKLMKQLGYGRGYQYDHEVEGGIALDQTAFPDALGERVYYRPVERGLELKLKEKLDRLRAEHGDDYALWRDPFHAQRRFP